MRIEDQVMIAEPSKSAKLIFQEIIISPWLSFKELTVPQKVFAISALVGGAVVVYIGQQLRLKRPPDKANDFRESARLRVRRLSFSDSRLESTSPESLDAEKFRPSKHTSGSNRHNWPELQRATSIDKELAASSGFTLVDGTPLTSQHLGLMGMEALETVISYWEDALRASQSSSSAQNLLTTVEEAEFKKMLESILEGAYQLQYESEYLFLHENSILNNQRNRLIELRQKRLQTSAEPETNTEDCEEADGLSIVSSSHKRLWSISSFDESFVSAQDTVADLRDFEDLNEILTSEGDGLQGLYIQALRHLEKNSIPYRSIRTDFVGCINDTEYLAKLHCLRIAFSHIMEDHTRRKWWIDSGRNVFSDLILQAQKNPAEFVEAYDDLMEYLSKKSNLDLMEEELQSRNVKIINFYDVVLDYILIDSFEDLETPPSTVTAVLNNTWLSKGFKETALHTAIWSVLKAKRRLLKNTHGFKAQFYCLSEILLPVLAWGFFGPDERLNDLMNFFKDQVLGFIRDLFNSDLVRYTCVEDMTADISKLAENKLNITMEYMQKSQINNQ